MKPESITVLNSVAIEGSSACKTATMPYIKPFGPILGIFKIKITGFLALLFLIGQIQNTPFSSVAFASDAHENGDSLLLDYRIDLPSAWAEVVIGEEISALMEEALRSNPDILEKKLELEASGYDLDAAQWGRFPNLSLGLETEDNGDNALVARVEQPLWTGGQLSGQIDEAEAAQRVAITALDELMLRTLLEVATTYYEIQRLKARLRISVINEDEHRRLLDIIKRRAASEVSAGSDQVHAEARYFQASRGKIQSQRSLVEATNKLERLVTREVSTLASPKKIDFGSWTEETLDSRAKEYSPSLKRLQAEVDVAVAKISLAKSGLRPRLVAGLKSSLSDDDRIDGYEDGVYVALRMQTGAGLSDFSASRAAASRKMASESALLAQQQELKREISTLWAEYQGYSEQVDAVRSLSESTSELVDSYLRQFQVGKKSWLDVLNAQREKTSASIAMADTEFPLMSIKIRILLLIGEIIPENVSQKL